MDTQRQVPADFFQRSCENALLWAVISLAEFHMFVCSFREILPGYSEPYFRYERWLGAAIFAALVVYLAVSAVRYPGTIRRIRHLLCKLCSFEQAYMLWVFVWYILVLAVWQVIKGREVNLFKENDWWLFEQVLMSFVFFPLPRILGSERAKRLIEPMIKLILIPHMLVWAWILLQYFRMNYVTFPSGGVLHVAENMSLSFGYNQNITGAGALIMMALCIYMISTQKAWRKLPYVFGAAIYLAILVLTNCRTSWYCTLLIAAGGSFLSVWYGLKEKHWVSRFMAGILSAGCCILFLHWFRGEMFILLEASYTRIQETAVKPVQATFTAMQTPSLSTLKAHVSLTSSSLPSGSFSVPLSSETGTAADYIRTMGGDDAGYLSGRIPLYKATLDLLFSRKLIFFFGIPSTDFSAAIYGRYGIIKYYPHPHNFLLAMGAFYGVPTMIFTAAFLVSVFIRCFRILFINKKPLFQGFWMIPVILAALAAEDMMESYLNLSAWSMTCITFYLFAGWVVAMDKETRENVERRENVV